MKKFLAIMLTVVMLFSVCACGANEKAEKYCSSCGEGIAKDVAFCSHCGASVNGTQSESENGTKNNSTTTKNETKQTDKPTGATKKPTETKKPVQTTKPVTTSEPTVSAHTHSYSQKIVAATCTEKGYTVFTCSCGDTYKDNYTNPTHTYSLYKCTKCGTVDKSHAYEYMREWIKENGKTNGEFVEMNLVSNDNLYVYGLSYSASTGKCYVSLMARESTNASTDTILLMNIDLSSKDKKFVYNATRGLQTYSHYAAGIIDGETFKEGSALSCTEYNGPSAQRGTFLEASRSLATYALKYLSVCVDDMEGITMEDLGFKFF